ncbi:hypothetical protein NIES4071_49910 [Calothrix sp. NIES-4071]|nr:hypothetical protein NIES4071_49910 [Calothrix sp. NIES-4071]BAZ59298.1 hypothetical protein NIES4105_49850 [Calothrix sp. NIES-4105]
MQYNQTFSNQRTRKTTANNKATTVALIVRVNPLTGMVQATTPNLFPEWVSYPELMGHLITEKWEPDSENDVITDDLSDEEANNIKRDRKLIDKFVNDCLKDCLSTAIGDEKKPRVLFMAEAQNARKILTWLQNPNLPANDIPTALEFTDSEKNRLWLVRLRVANNCEVPVSIIKGYSGSRGSGVFKWENVCEQPETDIYLSLRKPLTTEQGKNTLKVKQSRFDDGYRQAGNPRLLEIAIVHHPDIEQDKLAIFIHNLRNRWPYFADDISLPFPFPFARSAKDYAVSARDVMKLEDLNESEETEDLADSN